MRQAVEASLKRLRIDYIGLYWVHVWDQITPVEEVMRGLDDLVREGKVLYVGISDAPAWWIAQANTLAHPRGWSPFVGLQLEYSLIERTVERELIPMAKALNLGLTAWSPLANGVLTGKYHGHGSSEQGRMSTDAMKEFLPEQRRTDRIVAAVKTVSDQSGRSMAQVALAWLRYRPVPVIPIIGARKLTQLQDNLASFDLTLLSRSIKDT
jgi:aryl-alcohol dehydrogenase-like predicted oxidoreductase